MTTFKPLRGFVHIRRETPDAEKGGIIIPELYRYYGWRAKVLSVNEEVSQVAPGDTILFIKEYTVLPFPEREQALTSAEHIAAKITVEKDIERIMPLNGFVLLAIPLEKSPQGVTLVKKWEAESSVGLIVRCANDCDIIQDFVGHEAWYPNGKAIKCSEDDKHHVLILESEILCVKN